MRPATVTLVIAFLSLVTASAGADFWNQFNDPEASRCALEYIRSRIQHAGTGEEYFRSAFEKRVRQLYTNHGSWWIKANWKSRKCRGYLQVYPLLHTTELKWIHGDLNTIQRSYAKRVIFHEYGNTQEAYEYLRGECGVTMEAAVAINRMIRESLGYPNENPRNAPALPDLSERNSTYDTVWFVAAGVFLGLLLWALRRWLAFGALALMSGVIPAFIAGSVTSIGHPLGLPLAVGIGLGVATIIGWAYGVFLSRDCSRRPKGFAIMIVCGAVGGAAVVSTGGSNGDPRVLTEVGTAAPPMRPTAKPAVATKVSTRPQHTNEEIIMALTRAAKALDTASLQVIGQDMERNSHACAVRLGVLARFITDARQTPNDPQVANYASASAEICAVGPSIIHYYVESIFGLAQTAVAQANSSGPAESRTAPTQSASFEVHLSGWKQTYNAASATAGNQYNEGVGIRFPHRTDDVELTVCSSRSALHGSEGLRVAYRVDDGPWRSDRAAAAKRAQDCWDAPLAGDVLKEIAGGSRLRVDLSGVAARYSVDLAGAASAIRRAWEYREFRKTSR